MPTNSTTVSANSPAPAEDAAALARRVEVLVAENRRLTTLFEAETTARRSASAEVERLSREVNLAAKLLASERAVNKELREAALAVSQDAEWPDEEPGPKCVVSADLLARLDKALGLGEMGP